MSQSIRPTRTRARLLVAAIGVATVSYVGASGCASDSDADEAEHEDPTIEAESSARQLGGTQQELSISPTREATAVPRITLPLPTGNLVPPPPYEVDVGHVIVKNPLPPSGNLMAPPVVVVRPPKIVIPPPSGNLMAPPIEELDLQLEHELAR